MGYAQGALRDSVEEVHVQQELVIQTEESARGPPK